MKKLSEYVAKDIKGYEGIYAITNCGKVYSHSRVANNNQLFKGRWLKPTLNKDTGYLYVTLCVDNERKKIYIHKLVAQHFVDGWFEGAVVNHLDEDKLNNHWTNFEWTTNKKNTQYSLARTVTLKNPEGYPVTFSSIKEFAELNGLDRGHLNRVINGKRKSHKGWTKWD